MPREYSGDFTIHGDGTDSAPLPSLKDSLLSMDSLCFA